MRLPRFRARAAQSGFTLIESMVAVTLFAILGYALAVAVSIGNHSQKMVLNMASEDRGLRNSTMTLMQELRETRDSSIGIIDLGDLNSRLTFQMPIDNAGTADWGVYDKTLGATPALQNRVAWSLRYTVRDVVAGNGNIDKVLVRQVLDDLGAVVKEKVLVHGLRPGVAPFGFKVVQQGDVWQVTLSTTSQGEGQAGIRTVFHVQTRN